MLRQVLDLADVLRGGAGGVEQRFAHHYQPRYDPARQHGLSAEGLQEIAMQSMGTSSNILDRALDGCGAALCAAWINLYAKSGFHRSDPPVVQFLT